MTKETEYIDMMPRKAIEAMIASPKTPKHLKEFWLRKIRVRGTIVKTPGGKITYRKPYWRVIRKPPVVRLTARERRRLRRE
ncbi:MAG: hypothetical protein AB1485_07835 [Candidatus Thermoplasmatota archaeon]